MWSQPAESAVLNTNFTKYFPDLFSLLLITLNFFQGQQQLDMLSGYTLFSSPLGQALGHGFGTVSSLYVDRVLRPSHDRASRLPPALTVRLSQTSLYVLGLKLGIADLSCAISDFASIAVCLSGTCFCESEVNSFIHPSSRPYHWI